MGWRDREQEWWRPSMGGSGRERGDGGAVWERWDGGGWTNS